MEVTLSELLDRFTIARLKKERIGEQVAFIEYDALKKEIDIKIAEGMDLKEYIERLFEINGKIWDLEADLRAGQVSMSLEDVGRAALAIRANNRVRVAIKNEIVEKFKSGFRDIKMNHASEVTCSVK
jgi:hypothetical protein